MLPVDLIGNISKAKLMTEAKSIFCCKLIPLMCLKFLNKKTKNNIAIDNVDANPIIPASVKISR